MARHVVVQPSGARSFAVRYRLAGKSRKLTLAPGISLAGARKLAADAMLEVAQGRDPAAAKQAAKSAQHGDGDTLEAVAAEFFRGEGKFRSATDWQRDLARLVFPTLGKRPIAGIRRKDIVRLPDNIEDANGAAGADTALAIIRRIMNWDAVRDDDFRSPIVKGMGRRKPSEHARSRILDDAELRSLWRAADSMPGPFGHYVQFLLLTAARRNEAAHLRWHEIVGTDWTLPAARNKTKIDLTRPLSAAALAVLSRVPRLADCDLSLARTGAALAA